MKLEKGAAMKFQFFHLMPWDSFPKEEPEWPVSNRDFDPVEGTKIHDHGDPHSKEGFCNAIRVAYVSGKIEKKKFHSSSFTLIESPE